MNLNQLRAFHKVAEYGSFTEAAAALRVTQPALTSQIKGLERHYEVELFYRMSRSIELTPTGRELYEITEAMFGLVEKAEQTLTQSSNGLSGTLRIGADSPYQLVGLLEQFQTRYPGVTLEVSFGNSFTIATRLKKFQSDIGFLSQYGEESHLHSIHRLRDELVAVVNVGHPWAKRKSVTMKHFDKAKMIRREQGSNTQLTFDKACKANGVQPNYVVQMGSREALREAVGAGMGIGLIQHSELGNDERLLALPIRGAKLITNSCIVCLKTRKNAPLIRAFFGALGALGAS